MHTLLVEKTTESGEEEIPENEWKTSTRKDVKTKLKHVPVLKAASSNGAAKLHFKAKEDLDKAQDALRVDYKVTSKSEDKKKLNPKLTICIADIDPDVTTVVMRC